MSSFTFTPTIPAANNDPADDQGLMLQNNASTSGLIAVDHVGFNTANGGQHLQVTLPGNNTPGAQTALASTVYTAPGVANTNASMLHLKNSQATVGAPSLLLSGVRAWAVFAGTGGNPITTTQRYNVTTIAHPSVGTYNITIDAGALSSSADNFGVLVCASQSSGSIQLNANYRITGANTFQILTYGYSPFAALDSTSVTFIVYQI